MNTFRYLFLNVRSPDGSFKGGYNFILGCVCPYVLVCVCPHINFFDATHKLFSNVMVLCLCAAGGFQSYMCISRARASGITSPGASSSWLEPVPLPAVACLACGASIHISAHAPRSATREDGPHLGLVDSSDPQPRISTPVQANTPKHGFKTHACSLRWAFSRCSTNQCPRFLTVL